MLSDLSREEIALARRYPSHTPVCIRGGWEFCRPEQAVGEFPRNCCSFIVHCSDNLSMHILYIQTVS